MKTRVKERKVYATTFILTNRKFGSKILHKSYKSRGFNVVTIDHTSRLNLVSTKKLLKTFSFDYETHSTSKVIVSTEKSLFYIDKLIRTHNFSWVND